MIDPSGLGAAFRSGVVSGNGAVVDGDGSADDFGISLSTGRADLATANESSGKLLGMLADRDVCFVAKVDVGEVAWREITFASWVAGVTRAIEIDPTIQFDPDLFR